jgi:hypothetical protein
MVLDPLDNGLNTLGVPRSRDVPPRWAAARLAHTQKSARTIGLPQLRGEAMSDSSQLSATAEEQIDRANVTGRTPVVFIHGLWLLPRRATSR